MPRLTLCSVCHVATGDTTRLASGSTAQNMFRSGPQIDDSRIDTQLCQACLQSAAQALEDRVGTSQGVAVDVNYDDSELCTRPEELPKRSKSESKNGNSRSRLKKSQNKALSR